MEAKTTRRRGHINTGYVAAKTPFLRIGLVKLTVSINSKQQGVRHSKCLTALIEQADRYNEKDTKSGVLCFVYS